MTTIDRIFFLLHERNVSQLAFSKAIGVSSGNISDWKSGRSSPKGDVLVRLADYFDVSTDYLLGRTDEKSPGTAGAAPGDALRTTLLHNFDQLNQEGRERLVETSDDMVSSGKYIKSDPNKLGKAKDT